MSQHSRRDFLRGVGVTAAAATVAAIVPTGIAAAGEQDDGSPTPEGTVVVYLRDPKAGTVTVMKGESETTVTDKVLARKLAKLA
jgi:negative regulator of sigma E activity